MIPLIVIKGPASTSFDYALRMSFFRYEVQSWTNHKVAGVFVHLIIAFGNVEAALHHLRFFLIGYFVQDSLLYVPAEGKYFLM